MGQLSQTAATCLELPAQCRLIARRAAKDQLISEDGSKDRRPPVYGGEGDTFTKIQNNQEK